MAHESNPYRAIVAKLDALVKSRFIEMFGNPKTNNKQWPVKKIKELFKVTSAKRIYQSELVSRGIPFYKVADVNSLIDNVDPKTNQFISKEKYAELVQLNQVPKENDILMTARGTIGRCYHVKKTDKFYFQDGMITWLIPKSNSIINEFFVQYLSTDYSVNEIKKLSKGATVDFLSISKTENISVIVPDLSLQTQFLEFIKQVDKSKVIALKAAEKYDQLVKSRFIEIISEKNYPQVCVGKLMKQANAVEYIDNPENEKFITLSGQGKGVKQRTIHNGKTPVKFSGYRVKTGQFIYSRIDARNGAFGIVPDYLNNAVVSKDFPVFELDTDLISPEFLLYSLLQKSFLKQIQSSSFGATNRQRIKEDVFAKYSIKLPPMTVQTEFSNFVKQVDKSK